MCQVCQGVVCQGDGSFDTIFVLLTMSKEPSP